MPHKRNPELCERICGLARLIRGYAMTSLENINLWHERDISHSSTERIILPDACLALDYCLNLFTGIMTKLNVYPKKMLKDIGVTKGLVYSQRVLLALIDKGTGRQEAYKLVQRDAMTSWEKDKRILTLLKADKDVTAVLPPEEIEKLFENDYYLRFVDDIFNRLGLTETQWNMNTEEKDLTPRSL